jgi:hypothetical protein
MINAAFGCKKHVADICEGNAPPFHQLANGIGSKGNDIFVGVGDCHLRHSNPRRDFGNKSIHIALGKDIGPALGPAPGKWHIKLRDRIRDCINSNFHESSQVNHYKNSSVREENEEQHLLKIKVSCFFTLDSARRGSMIGAQAGFMSALFTEYRYEKKNYFYYFKYMARITNGSRALLGLKCAGE